MNVEDDYKFALRLQKQIDEEEKKRTTARNDLEVVKSFKPSTSFAKPLPNSSRTISLVDKSLEYIDPNPDIHALFLHFNDVFFWRKLLAVEVKWSPRMTSCAGICCYQGRGGLCSIRLSLPLLKLRPRKDLVETLLHEMIHAYLFVTCNNRDRDGHGPEFHKHMHRINQSAGTKITVYHSFHDEVRSYQQHWWQCQGPCRNRKPYFGIVRRAMNRPPGPSDFWWKEHKASCGGEYVKIREPEGFKKKGAKIKVKGKSESILNTNLSSQKSLSSPSSSGIQKYFSPSKSNGIIDRKKVSGKGSALPKPSSPGVLMPTNSVAKKNKGIPVGNVKQNVIPKTDFPLPKPSSPGVLMPTNSVTKKNKGIPVGDIKQNVIPKTDFPHVPLPKNFLPKKQSASDVGKGKVLEKGNTFVPFSGEGRVLGSRNEEPPAKKVKADAEVKCPVCGSHQLETEINEHLDQCIGGSGGSVKEQWKLECPGCGEKVDEEAFDEHLDECMAKRPPEEIVLSSDDEEEGSGEKCVCPACGMSTNSHSLSQHLDICLSSMSFEEEMQ